MSAPPSRRRARALLGLLVLVSLLVLVTWLTCMPAGATWTHRSGDPAHAAAQRAPKASVVVPPRIPAEGAPEVRPAIADPEDEAPYARLRVELAPALAGSLVARELPEDRHTTPIGAPESDALRSSAIVALPGGGLEVVDTWTTARGGRRFALRLKAVEGGAPAAEACVWDLEPPGAPHAWSGLAGTLSISRERWSSGDAVVVRYAVEGNAADGEAMRKSGLVRFVAP